MTHSLNTVSAHAFGKDDAEGFVRVPGDALRDVLLTKGGSWPFTSTNRPCPCCGSAEPQWFIYAVKLEPIVGVTVINDYDVCQCLTCGMVYANNIPDQRTVSSYYAAADKYTSVSESDKKRHAETARAIRRYLNPSPDAIIADIGSGAGGLMDALITAIPGITIINTDAVDELVGTFDGIVLSGVLEHVVDVRPLLRRIRDLLKPNGWLWIEVPDAGNWIHVSERAAPFQELSSEHVNFFTDTSLMMTLLHAGLQTDGCDYTIAEQTPTQHSATLALWARPRAREAARAPIEAYIADSTKRLERYIAAANALPSPCILWGAGTLTRRLWPHLRDKALYVTDGNTAYHGHQIGGVAIIPPADAARLARENHLPIVACTQGAVDSIQAAAATLGVTATALLDYAKP